MLHLLRMAHIVSGGEWIVEGHEALLIDEVGGWSLCFLRCQTRNKKQVFMPDTEGCKYKILLNSLTFI